MREFRHKVLVAGLVAASIAAPASASIIQVTNRAALGANLSIDWSSFGPVGSGISTPYTVAEGSEAVLVTSSQGELLRQQEGSDFIGNFALGAQLLTDAGSSSDTFSVGFATPVRSAGAQIQIDSPRTAPFTAYMDFYSATDVLLGEVKISGIGTTAQDNSAPFIGGVSTAADISFVDFWVANPPGAANTRSGDLAINTLDVAVPGLSVPAPGALALLVPVFGWLVTRTRRLAGKDLSAR